MQLTHLTYFEFIGLYIYIHIEMCKNWVGTASNFPWGHLLIQATLNYGTWICLSVPLLYQPSGCVKNVWGSMSNLVLLSLGKCPC